MLRIAHYIAWIALISCALPHPVMAQGATYQMHWVAVCGPDAFNPNRNAQSVQRGDLRVIVEEVENGSERFWQARNAETGESVWGFAVDGQVQELQVPGGCASSYFGAFEWNPAGTGDESLNFHVYNGFPASSREAGRFHAIGIRLAPSLAVSFTSPSSGQVVGGTIPVRVSTTGFTGSRQYQLLVDGIQRQTGTTSANSFTLWYNTSRIADGAHTISVRVTQPAQSASGNVSVTVRN
jgi:hypothetical protein